MDMAGTWMIGNSPRSDVNPALGAGWGAVFIPHAHTWVLEKEEIRRDGGRLVILDRSIAGAVLRADRNPVVVN